MNLQDLIDYKWDLICKWTMILEEKSTFELVAIRNAINYILEDR